jgi:hypothetical protein
VPPLVKAESDPNGCGRTHPCTRRRCASIEIVRILKAGFCSTGFPIYRCGAGDGQAVGTLDPKFPNSTNEAELAQDRIVRFTLVTTGGR